MAFVAASLADTGTAPIEGPFSFEAILLWRVDADDGTLDIDRIRGNRSPTLLESGVRLEILLLPLL
jgi:hypothetical protein